MKLRRLALLIFGAGSVYAAGVGVEFVGVMGSGKDVRVSLSSAATGASQWIMVGREFAGYTVSAYDAPSETVVLVKDGRETRLRLKPGKTKAGAAEPPESIRKAVLNNLRQLSAAADQFYLENGKTRTTYDELVGETKYVKRIVAADGESYRQLVFEQGRPLAVTTASGYSISYAP